MKKLIITSFLFVTGHYVRIKTDDRSWCKKIIEINENKLEICAL
jgi:hypothetical protein